MEYQLVMQLPVSEKTDFDRLLDLEGKLIIGMGDPHLVEGHDLGAGEMNIFVHTSDPIAAFSRVRELVSFGDFPELRVAYRSVTNDEYTNLWPEGSKESFSVT